MPKLTKEIELLNVLSNIDSCRLILESDKALKQVKIEALINLCDYLLTCGSLAAKHLTELIIKE